MNLMQQMFCVDDSHGILPCIQMNTDLSDLSDEYKTVTNSLEEYASRNYEN